MKGARRGEVLTFFGIGVVNREIEICTFSHLVLGDDLLLEIPHRDGGTIEGDPRRFSLGFEPVEHERRPRHCPAFVASETTRLRDQ
jgi:hypothetical protein